MSYFDDASLVMIPSGYKDQKVYSVKPLDGSGDLTFTRASGATRVASNGLIEKVRTNLILQSNTFSTTWVSAGGSGSTVTSGQADPDGGTNAWLLAKLSQTGRREQSITTAANEQTFSIVAKKGTSNFINVNVFDGTNSHDAYFNLDNGSVGTQSNAVGSIVSLGSGWYRCSVTSTNANAAGIIQIYISDNNGAVTGTTGSVYIYESQFENGVATDYIATTSAAVSVGPVSGLPRLDYLGSTCPRLLLEPQRTNLALYSEQFDNADWGNAGTTITANQAVSPDGYTNADLASNGASSNYIFQGISGSISGTFTASIFVKKGTQSSFAFGLVAGGFTGGMGVKFNFDTQTFSTPTNYANFTSISASYQSYGNGWYRLNLTGTTATSTTYFFVLGSLLESFAVNAYVYGAQLEAAAYATSYIPTLGSSVTRVADACSKTGISSLIGQTEGTLFAEFVHNGADILTTQSVISVNSGNTTNFINIGTYDGRLNPAARGSGVDIFDLFVGPNPLPAGTHKIALAYKSGDFAIYLNGTSIYTNTNAATFTLSQLDLGTFLNVNTQLGEGVKQAVLFPTRLSNSDLAALTA